MSRETPDRRLYATMAMSGKLIDVHPDVYEAIDAMTGNGFRGDGQITIHIVSGHVSEVKLTNCPVRILRYYAERTQHG